MNSTTRIGGGDRVFATRNDDPIPGILSLLKTETAAEHARIEQQLDLLRPSFTLRQYIALLERFYGYYQPWEMMTQPVLSRSLPHLTAGRAKTILLLEDLRYFGRTEIDLPRCTMLPPLNTLPQLLGSMYVLEGSTLGGQILSRHFAKRLHLHSAGLAFFWGYGEKTAFMWKEFCHTLVQQSNVCENTAIVSSAKHTFETMLSWLGN